jgi:hypothetical protein
MNSKPTNWKNENSRNFLVGDRQKSNGQPSFFPPTKTFCVVGIGLQRVEFGYLQLEK